MVGNLRPFSWSCVLNIACCVTVTLLYSIRSYADPTELEPGTVFRDCPHCPELVVLSPADFMMGPALGEEEDEGVPVDWQKIVPPQHPARVTHTIAVGKYPVTRGEYRAFASANYIKLDGCVRFDEGRWIDEPQWSWDATSFQQTESHPVVCVSWYDAQAYADWLQTITGQLYRLSTELEWEYAARSGTIARRYWGDDRGHHKQCSFANAADIAYQRYFPRDKSANRGCSDGFVNTSPVGSFMPNQFGLYDMLGNVAEWVEDCFSNSNIVENNSGDELATPDCPMRILRGGSWADPAWGVRAADRYRDLPNTRCMGIGFRVARDVEL